MATDTSYMHMYSSVRRLVNYDEVFPAAISKLSSEVNLASAKSCLMFGPGEGDRELQFIKQCATNISKLIAVEPDHESVERLRTRLTNSLPDVDSQVIETTIQNWKGLDDQDQVDLVLMMQFLQYVKPDERKELFKKLHEQWLAAGGRVVVLVSSRTKSLGYMALERLEMPTVAWEDIQPELLEAGFIQQHAHERQFMVDLSNLDESVLRFLQCHTDPPPTLDDVRNVIKEMCPTGKSDQAFGMFAVFQKM